MKRETVLSCIATVIVCVFSLYLYNKSGGVLNEEAAKQRQEIAAQITYREVTEGDFIDRNDRAILTGTAPYTSEAKYPEAYSYILGYNSKIYGTTGLRKTYKEHLYDDKGTGKGGSVKLTTDNILQKKAYQELKSENLDGSVIVLDNKTGQILALASRETLDYDITNIDENYERYSKIDGFFLNHAVYDSDAPGSVFKIITALCSFENNIDGYVYNDVGTFYVDNTEIHNANGAAYGEADMQKAFTKSINTYFASLAVEMGEERLIDTAQRCLIGAEISTELGTLHSELESDGSDFLLAQTGFGQGKTTITPLHIAMIGAALENDGKMMQPYIVNSLINAKGSVVYRAKEKRIGQIADKKYCEKVVSLMQNAAAENAKELTEISPTVGIKTGTAQLGNGKNHAYLLCVDENYTIMVSENDTQRYGLSLADIAKKLLKELYQKFD